MRWLDPAFPTYREPLTQHPNLNGFSQFGFGRRTCQGIPIVDQDLFLSFGGLAWAFDVTKKRDAAGNEIPVHWNDFTPLLIAKPKKFQFDLAPRSEEKMAAMREMYELSKEGDEEQDTVKMEEEIGTRVAFYGDELGVLEKTSAAPVKTDGESDHDVLINVRDSSPESEGGKREKPARTPSDPEPKQNQPAVPGAWS